MAPAMRSEGQPATGEDARAIALALPELQTSSADATVLCNREQVTYILVMTALSPIVSEFATSEEAAAYDAWFRAKITGAMADDRPLVAHDEVMREMKQIIEEARQRNEAS